MDVTVQESILTQKQYRVGLTIELLSVTNLFVLRSVVDNDSIPYILLGYVPSRQWTRSELGDIQRLLSQYTPRFALYSESNGFHFGCLLPHRICDVRRLMVDRNLATVVNIEQQISQCYTIFFTNFFTNRLALPLPQLSGTITIREFWELCDMNCKNPTTRFVPSACSLHTSFLSPNCSEVMKKFKTQPEKIYELFVAIQDEATYKEMFPHLAGGQLRYTFRRLKSGESYLAFVTSVTRGFQEFTVLIKDDVYTQMLNLMKAINSVPPTPLMEPPKAGMACLVKLVHVIFRALVLSAETGYVLVNLVDIGTFEIVPISFVFQTHQEYMKVEAATIRATLLCFDVPLMNDFMSCKFFETFCCKHVTITPLSKIDGSYISNGWGDYYVELNMLDGQSAVPILHSIYNQYTGLTGLPPPPSPCLGCYNELDYRTTLSTYALPI